MARIEIGTNKIDVRIACSVDREGQSLAVGQFTHAAQRPRLDPSHCERKANVLWTERPAIGVLPGLIGYIASLRHAQISIKNTVVPVQPLVDHDRSAVKPMCGDRQSTPTTVLHNGFADRRGWRLRARLVRLLHVARPEA